MLCVTPELPGYIRVAYSTVLRCCDDSGDTIMPDHGFTPAL